MKSKQAGGVVVLVRKCLNVHNGPIKISIWWWFLIFNRLGIILSAIVDQNKMNANVIEATSTAGGLDSHYS